MQNTSEDILDSVINVFSSRQRDLRGVTLEEAKQLTLLLLRRQRVRRKRRELVSPCS